MRATKGYFIPQWSKSKFAASKWGSFCIICFSHENSTTSVMNSAGAPPCPSLRGSPNRTMLNFLHFSSSNGGCQVPSPQDPSKGCINPTGSFIWLSHFHSTKQPLPLPPLHPRDQRYLNPLPKLPTMLKRTCGLPSLSYPHPRRLQPLLIQGGSYSEVHFINPFWASPLTLAFLGVTICPSPSPFWVNFIDFCCCKKQLLGSWGGEGGR